METEQKEFIENLYNQLTHAESSLIEVKANEDQYIKNINNLEKEKDNLSKDIDSLLEEMERLESGLEIQKDSRHKTRIVAIGSKKLGTRILLFWNEKNNNTYS